MIFAGPWLGEFGVYLGWIAGVRYHAQLTRVPVTVCARRGWEYLSEDFHGDYIPHSFGGIAVGSGVRCGTGPSNEAVAALIPADADVFAPVHTFMFGNVYAEPVGDKQLWIKYGRTISGCGNTILFHARARQEWGVARNWPQHKWDELADRFSCGPWQLVSVGTRTASLRVSGTEDLRGIPLHELANITRSSALAVGPSSGYIHFAALCCCPHVLWFGGDDGSPSQENDEVKMRVLNERYRSAWNPWNTPVHVIAQSDWQPSIPRVAAGVLSMLTVSA